jgi:hypothetical protein
MEAMMQLSAQQNAQNAAMMQRSFENLGRGIEQLGAGLGAAKREKKLLDEKAQKLGYTDWKALGIEAEARGMAPGAFYYNLVDEREKMNQAEQADLALSQYERRSEIDERRYRVRAEAANTARMADKRQEFDQTVFQATGKSLDDLEYEAEVTKQPLDVVVEYHASLRSPGGSGRAKTYTEADLRRLRRRKYELDEATDSVRSSTATAEQKLQAINHHIKPYYDEVATEIEQAESYLQNQQERQRQEEEDKEVAREAAKIRLENLRNPTDSAKKDVSHRLPDGTMYWSVGDRNDAMKKAMEAVSGEGQDPSIAPDPAMVRNLYQGILKAKEAMYPPDGGEQPVPGEEFGDQNPDPMANVAPPGDPSFGGYTPTRGPIRGIIEGGKALGSLFTGNWSGGRGSAPPPRSVSNPVNKAAAATASGLPPKPMRDSDVQPGVWYDAGDGQIKVRDSGERDENGDILFEYVLIEPRGR